MVWTNIQNDPCDGTWPADATQVMGNFQYRLQHVLPLDATGAETDSTYNLGSNLFRWDTLYCNSIDLGGSVTQYYAIAGNEFRGAKEGDNSYHDNAYGYSYIQAGEHELVAPLHLPHGAVMTQGYFKAYIAAVPGPVSFYMYSKPIASAYNVLGTLLDWGTTDPLLTGELTVTLNPVPATIDNANNYYYCRVNTQYPANRIEGGIITYTTTIF